MAGGDPRHLKVGRQTQRFGDAGRAGAMDILARDHKDRGGRVAERLIGLGHRRDVDIGKVLDREAVEVGR